MRVEADGGYGAHLGGVGGGAGVEMEGADVAVLAGEVPGGGNGEGDAVAGVVEGTSRRGVRLGSGRFGFALKEWRNRLGLAGDGLRRSLGISAVQSSRSRTVNRAMRGQIVRLS